MSLADWTGVLLTVNKSGSSKNTLPFMATISTDAKYLGVITDSKLSFNKHIDITCKKANNTLSFLRRNLYHCHRKVKVDAYQTYVRPILEYAATVWAPYTQRNISKLESIQRRAARFVMGDFSTYSSVTNMLANLQCITEG